MSLIWVVGITSSAAQVTRFVSTTGTNDNSAAALSWASSTTNLQGAIDASAPGDQVWVAQGIYKPTALSGPASRTLSFSMKNGVVIYGGFVGNEHDLAQRSPVNLALGHFSSTTLSGDIGVPGSMADNSYHVIDNPVGLTSSAVLDGFVITAGNANGPANTMFRYGGGMYNNGISPGPCNPTVRHCLFTDNRAFYGGGIYNNAGAATLNGTGGSASPTLIDCVFQRNTATQSGGAIGVFSNNRNAISNSTLTRCTFRFNSAVEGGAIYSMADFYGVANPTMVNCIFEDNKASSGGAIMGWTGYKSTGIPRLTNCSFMRNTAAYGGVYNNYVSQGTGSPQFTNCSFQANTGILYNDGYLSVVNPLLVNCVAFKNGAAETFTNLYQATVQLQYSLVDNTVTGYTSVNSLTMVVSPFLNSTSTNLSPCSPAINTGLTSATGLIGVTTDLSGNPRINLEQVDMGAYEASSLSAARQARLYVNASATGTNSGLDWANAFTDLQSALYYPCVADTLEIWVAEGIYKPTTTSSRDISFFLRNNVTIYGGFRGNETALRERPPMDLSRPLNTTLSGDIGLPGITTDNSYHVISNPVGLTTTAVLDGFVVTGGNADDNLLNGTRSQGGGMYNSGQGGDCNPTIRSCVFIGNSASLGGAIYNGGGVNGVSSPTIINCLFLNNSATSYGGAIFNYGYKGVSSPVITNCAFASNTCLSGGAIYNYGEYGISSPLLVNCSFADNLGGIVVSTGYQGVSNTLMGNCLAFNRLVTNGSDFKNSFGSSITAQYSLFSSTMSGYSSGPGNLTTNTTPFVSTTDLRLAPSSLAINSGNPSVVIVRTGLYSLTNVPETDLANQNRIDGDRIDMGAYEYQTAANQTVYSVRNGPWNESLTWSCGCIPTGNQKVQIGHIVTIPAAYKVSILSVRYSLSGAIIFGVSGVLELKEGAPAH